MVTDDSDAPALEQLFLAQDQEADALLAQDPLALVIGMVLDQQVPMERAFIAPFRLAARLGVEKLSPTSILAVEPDTLIELFSMPPALHRFPGAMAKRVRALCELLLQEYDGEVSRIWSDAEDGRTLVRRLKALPGFGEQKARIFAALLGKQRGIQPAGWREATQPFGDHGSSISVADVVDEVSLEEVRSHKRALKAQAKQSKE